MLAPQVVVAPALVVSNCQVVVYSTAVAVRLVRLVRRPSAS